MRARTRRIVLGMIALTGLIPSALRAQTGQTEATERRPYAPGTPQSGVDGTEEEPNFAVLPADDDLGYEAAVASDLESNGLKQIALDDAGDVRLSLGLLARAMVEHYTDESIGRNDGPETSVQFRFNPSVGIRWRDRARIYLALKHGSIANARFATAPPDRDDLDLHQGFFDLGFGDAVGMTPSDSFVRLGRQELSYCNGLQISVRGSVGKERFRWHGAAQPLRGHGRGRCVLRVRDRGR